MDHTTQDNFKIKVKKQNQLTLFRSLYHIYDFKKTFHHNVVLTEEAKKTISTIRSQTRRLPPPAHLSHCLSKKLIKIFDIFSLTF